MTLEEMRTQHAIYSLIASAGSPDKALVASVMAESLAADIAAAESAQRRAIASFAIARAKVALSTDARGYLMTMLERAADACGRVGVDAYAATDDLFAASDRVTDYAAIIARAESIVNDEAPVSAVSVGNYRDDSFDVEIVTLAGCSVIGRATMYAAPSLAHAEAFISRTFGAAFANACHDGADAHDGYWLA